MVDGRQGPRHVRAEAREAAIAALRAFRAAGQLTNARVATVAEGLGVARRTVWRWLAIEEPGGGRRHRGRFELSADDLHELAYWHGNVAALHRARGREPSLRTLHRAVDRALTPGRIAGLRGGEEARRKFDTYLSRPPMHRNECWEADHCELAIEVALGDGQVIKPWLTSFADRYSRALCGWAISGQPSQESVLAGLRAAILTEPPYGPIGGVPMAIRWDRGREFLAKSIGAAAGALAIDARPLPAYSPHLKGVIERLHATIEGRLLAELPGYTHALRRRKRTRTAQRLTLDDFIRRFAAFAEAYNAEYDHAGIEGETPAERWCADPVPVVEVAHDHLHLLMLARDNRIVGKKGIRMFGYAFNTADLVGLVGQTVEVRYMPNHHDRIEVFFEGRYIGRAVRADSMDDDEARRLRQRRVEEERWLARQERAAERRRTRRFAAVTESPRLLGEVDEETSTRVLTPSRSLVDHGEIPSHWVRPLGPDQVHQSERRNTRRRTPR